MTVLIKAFLFDLDDTLLDRQASVEPFMKGLYVRYDLNRHVLYQAYWEHFKAMDKQGYADKQEVFQAFVERYALPISVDELITSFRQNAWRGCKEFLFPDAGEVLMELHRRGYKLGIITNGSGESQRTKLSESGLASLVDTALISGEEQVKKPDQEIFIRAAERLGVSVLECVFVGDNPESDIGGADNAGMKTVWVKGYHPWPKSLTVTPHHTITSLAELLAVKF